MDHDLLPIGTEAPRCSEFARSNRLLPPGSGLFLERAILVTVPLPWPKPAVSHAWLHVATSHATSSPVTSRLFAMDPVEGPHFVEVYERHGETSRRYRRSFEQPDQIESIVAEIAQTPLGELPGADQVDMTPTLLVCTQGSHDTCCGTTGVVLADEIEAGRDYTVRRVSHTGGHRFAPTLLAFPEGRMWAFVDLEMVDRIATNSNTAADFINHGRGWWGAKTGPAQVAESVVRAELAADPFVAPTITAGDAEAGEPGTTFNVQVGEHQWVVQVEVGRIVPSISCESPGGLPAKPGREFTWSIVSGPAVGIAETAVAP